MVAVGSVGAGPAPGCVNAAGVDGLGWAEAPLEVLERALIQGWREQSAHMARWLEVLAAFDERGGWGGWGIQSCGHWLSVNCGISPGTAADHVRVARRLQELDQVRAAFAAGRISYSKVRAICRVATPDTQAELLALAVEVSAGQLERLLGILERQRRGLGISEDEKEARRAVRTWTDDDGMGHLEVIAHPDEIAVLRLGVDFGRHQLHRQNRTPQPAGGGEGGQAGGGEDRSGGGQEPRRAAPCPVEALLWTVRAGLDRLHGDPTYAPPSPYVIMIHVQEGSALIGDDGMVQLSGGLRLHPRRLQALACDATLRLLIQGRHGEQAPLDVGRNKRLITEKQRAALLAVYDTCDFDGCGVPARFCQWHHIDHWINGGATDRANLRPMCRRHHRLAHTKGARVVIGPNNHLIALHPNATAPPAARWATTPATDGTELIACNHNAGLDPTDPDQLRARWAGQHIDNFAADIIISHLLHRLDDTARPHPGPQPGGLPDTASQPGSVPDTASQPGAEPHHHAHDHGHHHSRAHGRQRR